MAGRVATNNDMNAVYADKVVDLMIENMDWDTMGDI